MDKPVWDHDFVYNGAMTVKVSCHPCDRGSKAFCNILGDQPLFYIDDATDDEEDLLFIEDMQMFPTDEKFLAEMKAKLNAYEKTAETLSKVNMPSKENVFDKTFLNEIKTKTPLEEVADYGCHSNLFKSYYDLLRNKGIQIKHDSTIENALYNRSAKEILLNSSLPKEKAAKFLIRSMRAAWNHMNGALLNPLLFQPEEAVLMNRLIAADEDVTVLAFLWDMKLAGEDSLWINAMSGSDYDICTAYAMEAMTDFRSIKSGLAARAAFEKWFMSGRCKIYDRDIIQIMMGGHTDVDIDDQDMSRIIAMDMIAAMGQRPVGRNYLSSIVTNIMNDPIFGEVRDRSNANFLWFVTFERRMATMEQELQDGQNVAQKDNVVELPEFRPMSDTKNADDNIASIFFLDHFRAG